MEKPGTLTFGLNVTLDGCCDHREGIADDELHDHFTQLISAAGAMLYGRTTYELMEGHWPAVARDENASRSDRDWARTLEEHAEVRRDFDVTPRLPVDQQLPHARGPAGGRDAAQAANTTWRARGQPDARPPRSSSSG